MSEPEQGQTGSGVRHLTVDVDASGQRLDARKLKAHIGRELRRRLSEERPENEQIVRLWDLRMRQWLPKEEREEAAAEG